MMEGTSWTKGTMKADFLKLLQSLTGLSMFWKQLDITIIFSNLKRLL